MSAPKRSSSRGQITGTQPHLPLRPVKTQRRRLTLRRRRKRALVRGLLLLLALSIVGSGTVAVISLYHVYSVLQGVTSHALPNIHTTAQVPVAATPPGNLANLNAITILLLGSDTDSKFTGGRVLTQTDMLVRVDLKNHHVTMLSLPRDLWLPTDQGWCCAKLDEISLDETDNAKDPLDAKLHGFAHTVATVEADFKVSIQAYAWVGLDGFIKVIDTLGGVDVDVLHPVVDDSYPADENSSDPYAYQRVFIPAGPQHLDGKTALEYVRSRHGDLLEDVGRTARQQEVLLALKKKLDNPDMLTHLDTLASDLQGSVLTSLSLPQVLYLATFLRQLPQQAFSQYVFGLPTYGWGAIVNSPDGQKWVEEPNWVAIHQAMRQLFPSPTS